MGEEEDEDHRTHDIFCEMAELFSAGDEKEWKETARLDFIGRVCVDIEMIFLFARSGLSANA